jgi:addiction module HigA family antidote
MRPKERKPAHPGEILEELYIKPLGLSQGQIAAHLGIQRGQLNNIIHGKQGVTPRLALRLADAFGTTPEFWMNLQSNCELWEAARKHERITALVAV